MPKAAKTNDKKKEKKAPKKLRIDVKPTVTITNGPKIKSYDGYGFYSGTQTLNGTIKDGKFKAELGCYHPTFTRADIKAMIKFWTQLDEAMDIKFVIAKKGAKK